ncbi:Pirin-domain-containing protein [Acaromyces ingoldii]|uniref:Pirin-domain-containing protein n=1 Tax=Acaromyces ingoldii TaxID=215250 RepID=A0A316YFE7_9BASI|nr:Pirin-domain-containing protein [Acaromyces ingoldii]PWN86803.1 Pirin-domain-containing protein [Acaromyces ingoldii]
MVSAPKTSIVADVTAPKPSDALPIKYIPRRWNERGYSDLGWLKTFHTFSFSSYHDPRFISFGPLRVINEDRVAPGQGFPTHPHRDAEIFSYVLSGRLTHRDSMQNVEHIGRGDVQFTSAGTGIRHSEYNDHATETCHFLQIWYTPLVKNLTPKYVTLPRLSDEDKLDKFVTLVKEIGTMSKEEADRSGLLPPHSIIGAHSSLVTRAALITPANTVEHTCGAEVLDQAGPRWIYVHVAMTLGAKDPASVAEGRKEAKVKVGDVTLVEGDGCFIRGNVVGSTLSLTNVSDVTAELLLFDLKPASN